MFFFLYLVLKWGNPPVRVKKGQIDFFAPRLALMISKTFISYKTYGTSLQMVKTNKGTQSSYYRPKMAPKMAILTPQISPNTHHS